MCGENHASKLACFTALGSSPRVRGKLVSRVFFFRPNRLIPACAGKTCPQKRLFIAGRAHPRVCGENLARGSVRERVHGSSPRVRGKHATALDKGFLTGLIPACAGKTIALPGLPSRCRAHPRVCGENPWSQYSLPWHPGSSPRVRGKLQGEWVSAEGAGLIPACAGKTIPIPSLS